MRVEKFKETSNVKYALRNKLAKVFFQDNLAYGTTKELIKRTAVDTSPRVESNDVSIDGY